MFQPFSFLGTQISAYLICVLAGILAAVAVLFSLTVRERLEPVDATFIMLYAFLGVFVGGCLLYGVTNIPTLVAIIQSRDRIPNDEFWGLILSCFRGSVFYGGLLGAMLALFLYRRKHGLTRRYSDMAAVVFPVFHFCGRIGCFLGGCCYGVECSFGVVYRYASVAAANGVTRFPVQLVEALFNLGLFLVLLRLFCKGKCRTWLLQIYLLAYPVFRFGIEFLRGDDLRGILWGLSTSQWISLLLLLGNGLVYLSRRRKTEEL